MKNQLKSVHNELNREMLLFTTTYQEVSKLRQCVIVLRFALRMCRGILIERNGLKPDALGRDKVFVLAVDFDTKWSLETVACEDSPELYPQPFQNTKQPHAKMNLNYCHAMQEMTSGFAPDHFYEELKLCS